MTTTSERQARSRATNFSVWLVAGVLAINVLISTFTALSLLEARREYDEHAAQTTRNLALTLERELAGLIRSSDIVLQTVIDEFYRLHQGGVVDAGDQALKQLAYRIRTSLREVDLVARWGGEEFVALLPETDALGAVDLAERFRQSIAESIIPDQPTLPKLTVSIGIASLTAVDESVDAIVDRADEALYRAKNAGRNRVELARSPVLA